LGKAGLDTIGIIGLGLIGGSLAAVFKQSPNSYRVIGYNRNREAVREALEIGLIDQGVDTIEELAELSDVVFICVPVTLIPGIAATVAEHARLGTIITDAGSTKARLVAEIEPGLKPGIHFIGGHPMAGSERHGVKAASATLFKNKHYLLTPTENTDMEAYGKLHSLITETGANVLAIQPDKHDKAVATISHLPHIVSAALMNLAAREAHETENLLLLAAGGFKDTTRIAAGSPAMWIDICLENKDAIADALTRMIDEIQNINRSVEKEDTEGIRETLEKAQAARLNLPSVLGKDIEGLYELYIPVSDKPGVISDITLTVGQLGVNIEDIEILHATENSGTLRIGIPGKDSADKAATALSQKGYEVDLTRVK
jgi:prephenate dehydrogenase